MKVKNKHKFSSEYKYLYPNFCRINHEEIGYCEEECPLCCAILETEKVQDQLTRLNELMDKWSNRIEVKEIY